MHSQLYITRGGLSSLAALAPKGMFVLGGRQTFDVVACGWHRLLDPSMRVPAKRMVNIVKPNITLTGLKTYLESTTAG